MRQRLWIAPLALGVPAAIVHPLLPTVPSALVYVAIGVAGVAAVLGGARWQGLRPMGPWVLVAAGLLAFLVGDIVWYVHDLVLGVGPFPSVADLFYLLGYPLLAGGLAWLARPRGGAGDRETIIDASIVTIGAGVFAWVYFVVPAATDTSLTVVGRLIAGAYPVGDLLVMAVFVRLLFTEGRVTIASTLLGAGFVVILLGDIAFNAGQLLAESAILDPLADVLYALSYVFAGAAALHPSIAGISAPGHPARRALSKGRLALLAIAALLAPVLLAVQTLWGQQVAGMVIAVSSATLFLLVVVRMSGLVTELEVRASEVEALARLDGLTGAMNRRGWDERLPVELTRARRAGTPVAVALLDLDHFKDFNDQFGHPAGDELLRSVANAWAAALRAEDVLARYGGEEFGLILPGSDALNARIVVERLRVAIPVPYTASAGVAIWDEELTGPELVARADEALYRAKRAGRNRTVIADTLAPGRMQAGHLTSADLPARNLDVAPQRR